MTRLKDEVLLRLATEGSGATTQQDLAPIIGVTAGQLSRLLSNPRRRLSPDQVGRFASFLGVSPQDVRELLREDYELERTSANREPAASVVEYRRDREARVDELAVELRDVQQRLAQLERLIELTDGEAAAAPDRRPAARRRR